MRKSLLAMAALMGVSVLPAKSATFRVDEDTFANMGVKLQIWAQQLGKTRTNEKSYTDFAINNARVYFNGQVNKIVQFGANFDFAVHGLGAGRGLHQGTGNTRATDAFINLRFADELNVKAGLYRLPFSRASLTDSYSYIIPTGYGYIYRGGELQNPFVPLSIGSAVGNTYRDAGLTVWGNVMDGMIKYYLGVFDGRYDIDNKLANKNNLAYAVRVQFTPTMLGYKAEKGFTLADSYLGRQNVLSIGVGYNAQKWNDGTESATAKIWAVDALWEQKFGDIVPNLQLGYLDAKDVDGKDVKYKAWYAQGQLLYDRVVGLGKPALAVRYEKLDDRTDDNADVDRVGVFVNYYIKGFDAAIQLGADSVKLKNKDPNEKNYTDWTLALQIQF